MPTHTFRDEGLPNVFSILSIPRFLVSQILSQNANRARQRGTLARNGIIRVIGSIVSAEKIATMKTRAAIIQERRRYYEHT